MGFIHSWAFFHCTRRSSDHTLSAGHIIRLAVNSTCIVQLYFTLRTHGRQTKIILVRVAFAPSLLSMTNSTSPHLLLPNPLFTITTFEGSRSVRLFTEVRRLSAILSKFSLRRWWSFVFNLASRRAVVASRREVRWCFNRVARHICVGRS